MRWTFTYLAKPDYDDILPLADVKKELDVTTNDDDALITRHRNSAIDWVQSEANRFFLPTRILLLTDSVGSVGVTLPFAPVQSVEAMRVAGIAFIGFRTVAGEPYTILAPTGQPWPSYTTEPGAIEVEYTVGYPDIADAPPAMMQAVLCLAGMFYDRSMAEADWEAVRNIIHPIRYGGMG